MKKYCKINGIEQYGYDDQGRVKSKLMTQPDFENANSQKRCDICRLKHIKPKDEHSNGSKHLPRCSHTTTNWRLYKLAKEREIVKIKKETRDNFHFIKIPSMFINSEYICHYLTGVIIISQSIYHWNCGILCQFDYVGMIKKAGHDHIIIAA